LRRAITAPFQIAATIVGAFGIYLLSDWMGGSGIFAAVTFGIALREFERRRISLECSEGVRRFWSTAAGAANVVLFFLLGAAVDAGSLQHSVLLMVVTAAAVVAARLLLAYGLLQFARAYVTRAWMNVVRMAGVRGALSVALALSLPASFSQRSALIGATFAVAVATMLLGMLTFRRRLQRMNV
jgi:CPA1 family monovalent cation:H+ antiporter